MEDSIEIKVKACRFQVLPVGYQGCTGPRAGYARGAAWLQLLLHGPLVVVFDASKSSSIGQTSVACSLAKGAKSHGTVGEVAKGDLAVPVSVDVIKCLPDGSCSGKPVQAESGSRKLQLT